MTVHRYVIGIEPDPDLDPATVRAFAGYYDGVHIPEVVARNTGFLRGRRLERVDGPGGGHGGPRWVSVYELADGRAAGTYLGEQREAGRGRAYTPGAVPWSRMPVRWRLLLRQDGGADGPGDIGDTGTVAVRLAHGRPLGTWAGTGHTVAAELTGRMPEVSWVALRACDDGAAAPAADEFCYRVPGGSR
ncbi:hypothetical protein WIS52_19745 [Pseudonocardia nematodicida]|uniref:Uncharacterized protein n=1 Tax=Pseudonocardia nematodicida TaxID=1206997 RepID=A0ABV1KGJ1_9PSEU